MAAQAEAPAVAPLGTVAAIDLGSNSFHMIVADVAGGRLRVVDRLREMVRLAAGLDDDHCLTDAAVLRALACLRRFGERVRGLPRGSVRVVGTNTLRKARDGITFIGHAEAALGHPIDVISGFEEARLIYLGVCHGLEGDDNQRLVIDIGGGSTEFILGRRSQPLLLDSLHIGCVELSERFFADGVITPRRLRDAEIAALQEIESIESAFRGLGWRTAVGASGTMLAVHEVLLNEGWSRDGITATGLRQLRQRLLDAGRTDALGLRGLSAERRLIFPGGVAILNAAFEGLGLDLVHVSDSSLREGVLYDLLGRLQLDDIREQTIADLALRYHVDAAQAERVTATAADLLRAVAKDWKLDDPGFPRLLRWAARLHEIGVAISHSQYHKHGAYLLTHLDMPGFSVGEQRQLAVLVRSHRRALAPAEFERFDERVARPLLRLALLLRLTVVLHRRRSDDPLPTPQFKVDGQSWKLRFPEGWLDAHPLTRADLEQEAAFQKAAGIKLKFR
ncbi:MAG: Ppx/GppA family phosphatase [Gammaproteobacteria bacterium]|nr:Ppx/GppA family phosphatase [Gammaproteobacteria bacterium]